MNNISNTSESFASDTALADVLTLKLNEIQSISDMTRQKSDDLWTQIVACESVQEYLDAALLESQRIAREITRNAELRVENIMANAHRVIYSQQEQIACIDQEITELTDKISMGNRSAEEHVPALTEITSIRRAISPRKPEDIDIEEDIKKMNPEEASHSDLRPEIGREFSLREPQNMAIIKDTFDSEGRGGQIAHMTEIQTEVSLTGPQNMDVNQDRPVLDPADESKPELQPPPARREFSLREPQGMDIPGQNTAGNRPEQNEPDYGLGFNQELLPESPLGEISNYNLAMNLAEEIESNLSLDVFVDVRYRGLNDGGEEELCRHSWQVKIEVEAPGPNHEFVGYGKISSAVSSTLLRYDNVILNDAFPFDTLTPNIENIAGYFFNCLQDTILVLDLKLSNITIWDNQNLVARVDRRNTELDAAIRGEDFLGVIRDKLYANEKAEARTEPLVKGILGQLFKK